MTSNASTPQQRQHIAQVIDRGQCVGIRLSVAQTKTDCGGDEPDSTHHAWRAVVIGVQTAILTPHANHYQSRPKVFTRLQYPPPVNEVLLFADRFLFTGDHLAWDRDEQRLAASESYCWYSWTRQADSMN